MHTVENICVSWTSINQLVQKSEKWRRDRMWCALSKPNLHKSFRLVALRFPWGLLPLCKFTNTLLYKPKKTMHINERRDETYAIMAHLIIKIYLFFCWRCLSNSTIIYFLSVEMALITFHLHFPLRLYINSVLKLSSARPVPWPFVGDVHVRTKIGGKFGSPALVSPDSLSVE